MNQDNNGTPSSFPVKRRPGRPCKYPGLTEFQKALIRRNKNQRRRKNTHTSARYRAAATKKMISREMVDEPVQGVVEGTFGGGYLLSVRVGNSQVTIKGVFKPRQFFPAKMTNPSVVTKAKAQMRRENSHTSAQYGTAAPKKMVDKEMVGQPVQGVVEETFPNGCIVSARVGNSEVTIRGVFKARQYIPPNITIPSVVTKGEASGGSKDYKFRPIMLFGDIVNEIVMKRGHKQSQQEQDQTQSQQEESETQAEEQVLCPEPLRAVYPADVSSVIIPMPNVRAGKWTALLQAVENAARGIHNPTVSTPPAECKIFGFNLKSA